MIILLIQRRQSISASAEPFSDHGPPLDAVLRRPGPIAHKDTVTMFQTVAEIPDSFPL